MSWGESGIAAGVLELLQEHRPDCRLIHIAQVANDLERASHERAGPYAFSQAIPSLSRSSPRLYDIASL